MLLLQELLPLKRRCLLKHILCALWGGFRRVGLLEPTVRTFVKDIHAPLTPELKIALSGTITLLLLLTLGNAVLLWIYHPVEIKKLNLIIMLNAITVLISTAEYVLRWLSGEKRYRKIINKEFSER